ncbi:RIB43A-like with coiled-coils protein 2 [Rhodnius prolixus]|uniref:RIB43A-like with coiled-coils protein 2 n=1 Tax=Rhodnius prolixus TaxID=13249 RepID=UPI003D18FBCB
MERFFNAKNQIMEEYKEALLKQIQEKKERKKLEEEKEEAEYKKILAEQDRTNALQAQKDNKKRELAREIDVYRLTEQQKHKSREFDLNDPKKRFEEIHSPSESTDGSFLKFPSEDCDGEKVKAFSKQIGQFQAKEENENITNKNITHLDSDKDFMKEEKIDIEALGHDKFKRTQTAKSIMEYNLNKADCEREKRRLQKQQDIENEQARFKTCGMFAENPESTSCIGHNIQKTYNFRGLSEEEKLKIRAIQKKQIEELEVRKNAEKASEEHWNKLAELQNNEKTAAELQASQQKKDINRKIFEENLKLAAEQAMQRKSMKKMDTDNFPNNDYFNRFNTTTR